MRRVFALLLVTPLLANCTDSATQVAPRSAAPSFDESPMESPFEASEELQVASSDEASPVELVLDSPLMGAPGTGEVMEFGNPQAGTDYEAGTHDQSLHGKDRVIPGTVVIDAGQTVKFMVHPGHRMAVYKPGWRPEDITVNPTGHILDPKNRLALQPSPAPPTYRFNVPGRYLVICVVRKHFILSKMYGYVIVR
jgi:plastocyanin